MKQIMLLLCLFWLFAASAAEVSVQGKHISDTRCRYSSTSTGSFSIEYRASLQWGDRVFVKYAYHNDYSGMEWFDEQTKELTSTAPYTWNTGIVDTISSRGEFSKGQLKFVFVIEDMDGNIYYDKGSDSLLGYYRVYIPKMTCNNTDPMNSLYIDSILK